MNQLASDFHDVEMSPCFDDETYEVGSRSLAAVQGDFLTSSDSSLFAPVPSPASEDPGRNHPYDSPFLVGSSTGPFLPSPVPPSSPPFAASAASSSSVSPHHIIATSQEVQQLGCSQCDAPCVRLYMRYVIDENDDDHVDAPEAVSLYQCTNLHPPFALNHRNFLQNQTPDPVRICMEVSLCWRKAPIPAAAALLIRQRPHTPCLISRCQHKHAVTLVIHAPQMNLFDRKCYLGTFSFSDLCCLCNCLKPHELVFVDINNNNALEPLHLNYRKYCAQQQHACGGGAAVTASSQEC